MTELDPSGTLKEHEGTLRERPDPACISPADLLYFMDFSVVDFSKRPFARNFMLTTESVHTPNGVYMRRIEVDHSRGHKKITIHALLPGRNLHPIMEDSPWFSVLMYYLDEGASDAHPNLDRLAIVKQRTFRELVDPAVRCPWVVRQTTRYNFKLPPQPATWEWQLPDPFKDTWRPLVDTRVVPTLNHIAHILCTTS